MRRVYFGFSKPIKAKVGSELIKWWTNAPYSHCYVRFISEKLDISNVYHAAHGMVHFRELDNFLKDNIRVTEYRVDLTDEQYDDLLKTCMKLSGEGYGYLELLGIVLIDIAYKLNIPLKIHDGKGYICSELAGFLCVKLLNIEFSKPAYLLVPPDVDKALRKKAMAFEGVKYELH